MNWLQRARREIRENAKQRTANSAERNLTAVMAVPAGAVCEKLRGSIAAGQAEALVSEAMRAGIIIRLVDPRPREQALGRPFTILLRYRQDSPPDPGLLQRLKAAREAIYALYLPDERQ